VRRFDYSHIYVCSCSPLSNIPRSVIALCWLAAVCAKASLIRDICSSFVARSTPFSNRELCVRSRLPSKNRTIFLIRIADHCNALPLLNGSRGARPSNDVVLYREVAATRQCNLLTRAKTWRAPVIQHPIDKVASIVINTRAGRLSFHPHPSTNNN
jgi:hypothetical protein